MFVSLLLAMTLAQDPSPRPVVVSPTSPVSATNPGSLPDRVQPGERRICRSESVVGSNRRQRVCMTQAQRDQRREESRDYRNRMDTLTSEPLPEPSGG